MEPIRLNIGAGERDMPGFRSLDIATGDRAEVLASYADNSVEEIYASHVLEHFSHHKVESVVREWVRVLRPGGRMRVAVPDFEWMCRNREHPYLQHFLYGSHKDVHDQHRCAFDEARLTALLKRCGLKNVQRFESEHVDCTKWECSLNLEATKREAVVISDRPTLVVATTQPRLTFTDHMMSMVAALRGCELSLAGGAYWEPGITGSIENAVKLGPDYVLTVDYDTVFDASDVKALFDIMQSNPSLSAVFPVQASRHHNNALVHNKDADHEGDLAVQRYGHFGLTLIRSSVFAELPHPWFWSMPGQDGRWDAPDKRDADIQFWDIMHEHGFRVAQANRVQVGHLELGVLFVDAETGEVRMSSHKEWRKNGKPAWARGPAPPVAQSTDPPPPGSEHRTGAAPAAPLNHQHNGRAAHAPIPAGA